MERKLHVACGGEGCDVKLRLTVTNTHLGRQVMVTCPTCKTVNRVTIPTTIVDGSAQRQKIPDLKDPFGSGFGDVFKDFFGRGN